MRHVLLLLLSSLGLAHSAGADALPVLYLIGDSTMANKPVIPANPERGWGQMLPVFFQESIRVENHAVNGRSSKSFMAEGRWAAITNRLKAGDWVIIQFGHNDEKDADPQRFTQPFGSFQTNLVRYVQETRQAGANPILATAVVRRSFNAEGKLIDTHRDYIPAVGQIAAAHRVPLLDLNARSAELVQRLGVERSKPLYLWVGPEDYPGMKSPKEDNTHFSPYGATRMCDLAVDEISKTVPDLAAHLRRK